MKTRIEAWWSRLVLLPVLAAIAGVAAAGPASAAAGEESLKAGLRQVKLEDPSRGDRPVWVDLWYPAPPSAEEKPQLYGLGGGHAAWGSELAPAGSAFPVIVMSHGAMGSARSYGWLAERLARRGYVVVGVSHYGESWLYGEGSVDPPAVLRLWERPLDLSFALTKMLEGTELAGRVDETRIAALGHSSGGNSVIALGGARYDPARMAEYCRSEANPAAQTDRGCLYGKNLGEQPPPPVAASASYRDQRIRAIVALDPAVGPGYTAESLAVVDQPVLVIGAVANDFLPFASHAGRYADLLPNATSVKLDHGEGHFVFLEECSSDLQANGVPLCRDRPGVDRGAVHARIASEIVAFLEGALK